MLSVEGLKNKIKSAEDLHAIVKTMKTLAAVNIHHYEKAVESISEYYQTIEMGLQVVLRKGPAGLMEKRAGESGGLCAVVFGSDQGLCGGFNNHIVTHALNVMNEYEAGRERRMLICIGSRANILLEEAGHPVEVSYSVPGSLAGVPSMMQQIVMNVHDWQKKRNISRKRYCTSFTPLWIFPHPRCSASYPYRPECFAYGSNP